MADATKERLAYARRVMDEVQRTWLRLPWSSPLQNLSPVALLTTLELYAGDTPADSPARDFRSPSRAIRGALANVSVALLIGEAAGGKTTSLQWTAFAYARRCVRAEGSEACVLPVYVDLRDWDVRYPDCQALDELLNAARPGEAGTGPVIWLLDNVDRLPADGAHSSLRLLDDVQERSEDQEAIVLGLRPVPALLDALGVWTTSHRLTLSGLPLSARSRWLRRHVPEARAFLDEFARQSPDAAPYLYEPQPFMLTVAASLDAGRPLACGRAAGRTGIIEGFVNYALQRGQPEEQAADEQAAQQDEEIVEDVCWAATLQGQAGRIVAGELLAWLSYAFAKEQTDTLIAGWPRAAARLEHAGLLFMRDAPDRWEPLHETIAGYWVARYLARSLRAEAAQRSQREVMQSRTAHALQTGVAGQALAILTADGDGESWIDAAFHAAQEQSAAEACALMVDAGAPVGIARVIESCGSDDPATREAAAQALAKAWAPQAASGLTQLLGDEHPSIRSAALRGLLHQQRRRTDWPSAGVLKSLLRRVRGAAAQVTRRQRHEPGLSLVTGALRDPTYHLYWKALQAVRALPRAQAEASLRGMLADSDPVLRRAAANSLSQLWGHRALASFQALAEEPHDELRQLAGTALEALQDDRLFETLMEQSEDADEDLRASALASLGSLATQRLTEDLIANELPLGPSFRWVSMNVWLEMGGTSSQELLHELLKHSDPHARWAATQSLTDLRESRAFFRLFDLLRYPSRAVGVPTRAAIRALKLESAFEPLLKLLADPHEGVRRAGVRALGRLGSEKILQRLMARVRGEEAETGWRFFRLLTLRLQALFGGAEPSPAPANDIFSEELPGCSPIVLGIVVAVVLFFTLLLVWIWIAM